MSLKGDLMAAHVEAMLVKEKVLRSTPGMKLGGHVMVVKFRDVKTEVSYAEAMFKIGYVLRREQYHGTKFDHVVWGWAWAMESSPTDFVGSGFIRTMRRYLHYQHSLTTGKSSEVNNTHLIFRTLAGPAETPEATAAMGLRKLLD